MFTGNWGLHFASQRQTGFKATGRALALAAAVTVLPHAQAGKTPGSSDKFTRSNPPVKALPALQEGFTVEDLARRLPVFTTDKQLMCKERFDPSLLVGMHPASAKEKERVAREIYALLKNRPNLLEARLLHPDPDGKGSYYTSGLKIVLSNASDEGCDEQGSSHNIGAREPYIFLRKDSPFLTANRTACTTNVGHEVFHVLEGSDKEKYGRLDGYFPGMSPMQRDRLDTATDTLVRKYLATFPPGSPVYRGGMNQSIPGIRDYAFGAVHRRGQPNLPELRAETVAAFITCPDKFYTASPELYDIYREMLGVDPAEAKTPQ